MLSLLFSDPIGFFIAFGGLVISLTLHEFAHAWTADHLGDPTPRSQGRVSLDPRVHLDPWGTIALLLVRFGWGRPVEVDPFNFRHPIRDNALVALAGPATNLAVAALLALIVRLIPLPEFAMMALVQVLLINVVLAVFNAIPIHPLDGSKIILPLLPKTTAIEYEQFMHRYGLYLLLALIIPWTGGAAPITYLIGPVIQLVAGVVFL